MCLPMGFLNNGARVKFRTVSIEKQHRGNADIDDGVHYCAACNTASVSRVIKAVALVHGSIFHMLEQSKFGYVDSLKMSRSWYRTSSMVTLAYEFFGYMVEFLRENAHCGHTRAIFCKLDQ